MIRAGFKMTDCNQDEEGVEVKSSIFKVHTQKQEWPTFLRAGSFKKMWVLMVTLFSKQEVKVQFLHRK